MMFSFRRKPLALLICCAFAGTLAGGLAGGAAAAEPLRVDPVLLGLPALKPAEALPPAAPVRAVSSPVEAPVVESVPVTAEPASSQPAASSRKASAREIPARAAAPQPAPAVAVPSPAPAPAETLAPLPAAPARDPRDDERKAAPVSGAQRSPAVAVPPADAAPSARQPAAAPTAASSAPISASALAPLRVDPVLLGLPPLKPAEASLPVERVRTVVKPVSTPVVEASPTPLAPSAAQPAVAAVPAATSAPAASVPPSVAAPTLAPLRVDPALLGAPPVVAERPAAPRTETHSASAGSAAAPRLATPADTLPPQVAASGARDEEEVPSDLTPALALRSASKMVPPPSKSETPRPVFLSAQRMSGTSEREAVAEGAAQLRKIGTVVDADRMTYWPIDDELEAIGNVRLEQGDDWMSGPKMRLKLEEQVGFFKQPSYFLRRESAVVSEPGRSASSAGGFSAAAPLRKTTEAHGQAQRIDFEGVNQIRLTDATYTTCKPDNDGWYATASDLKLDYDREEGDGSDAVVYFKGVPILYSPWMSFSLNNNRKSGLLSPTFGSTSNSGLELTLPYYWNIAPNMDATIAPRALSKRGTQVGSEFRYLGASYNGEARAEILQNDKIANRDRYAYSLQHAQNLGYGFAGTINYNKVSDDKYFTDLSSRMVNTSQTQLLQQGLVSYGGGGWWSATANMQTYQTLQPDPNNPVAEPYRLKPQLTLTARQPDLYRTDSSFLGQFTSFSNPVLSKPEARRTVLYPQVALPYETPGWYVTPKIGVHATYYSLNRQTAGTPDSLNRTLPIFSLDSGMTFERPSNWFGRDYAQTLEPRLFYLNVPYRDQSNIPVFDSGLADFNFAQIFSENQFVGQDRINDANQLTAALTSRLIDPASGSEIMRAMIGQRYYYRNQQVTLPDAALRVWDRSNFLAAFSGRVLPKVYADAATEYNTIHGSMERMSLGGRYVPEPGKVLNVAYRFNSNALAPIKQVDVSGQWPIYGGWHAVGRSNYSLQDKAPIENVAGLEYNGGCWVLRLVGQRLATTSGTASTAIFVQLELNDFSQIGSNPLDLLKRSIQGYGRVNQSTADPVFGQ